MNPADWFLTADEIQEARGGRNAPRRSLSDFTSGNLVEPLVDGEEAMRAFLGDLTKARQGDFVHLTAWRLTAQVRLDPSSSATTVLDAWRQAIKDRKVVSRTLLWHAQGGPNSRENARMRTELRRTGGTAVLDARFPLFGSHHQKSGVVQREGEIVGYCGGIDFTLDRWDSRTHDGSTLRMPEMWKGWHDVHTRVRGPAALDIELNFRDRWNDPKWPRIRNPERPPARIPRQPLPRTASSPGSHHVQVLRTFACDARQFPSFAPCGEFTSLAGYRKAIQNAKRYIYIEDQYLYYDQIARDLASALRRVEKIVIVVPRRNDFPKVIKATANFHQHQFIELARSGARDKVHVYDLVQPSTGEPIYVHSKLLIVDDAYAYIGSANVGRRSMTHDTELGVAVVDANVAAGRPSFARDLRLNLWSEHLGLTATDARIADPVQGVAEWERQAKAGGRRVRLHDAERPRSEDTFRWDHGVDPSGRCR